MTVKKWIYAILFGSLAINLFLAGMLTVFLWKGGPDRPPRPPEQFNMFAAREVLEPGTQEIVDQIWRDFRRDQRGAFRSIFQLREEMRDILADEKFDEEGFERVFAELQESGSTSRMALVEVLREINAALPPGERARYFKAGMERKGSRRDRRHDRGFEEDPEG